MATFDISALSYGRGAWGNDNEWLPINKGACAFCGHHDGWCSVRVDGPAILGRRKPAALMNERVVEVKGTTGWFHYMDNESNFDASKAAKPQFVPQYDLYPTADADRINRVLHVVINTL